MKKTNQPGKRKALRGLVGLFGDQPTKKDSLPSGLHKCIDCHEDKPIVSHGRCNRCHLRWKREQQAPYLSRSTTNPGTGHRALATLYKLMAECKVISPAKEKILKEFLPFSGLPDNVIKAALEALDRTAEEEDSDQS